MAFVKYVVTLTILASMNMLIDPPPGGCNIVSYGMWVWPEQCTRDHEIVML